ncbi:PREDICTED: F-box protein At3g49450-like [Camelina sativa]|uniref:F-box protein At3g49450-like n=1 Tax=Camelina sativa TaxID=90675 RepID=A0ABM0YNF8_CAMSA|nr:PREDICTED: F-box protein At3g49450-like [Camelina sativa]
MSAKRKRKEHVSKDEAHLTKSSTDGLGENSGTLPTDVMVEILSRLPAAKSVARARCVSKNWNALLRNPYFTNKFLTRSSARPRLLFTFQAEGKWSFFSSPEYVISDNNSNLVVVESLMGVPKDYTSRVCVPVCGLLCTKDEWVVGGRKDARMMICNPSTGQVKSLPKVRSRRGQVITYLGYDPIGIQYKVLCMTICERPFLSKAEEYQVLTLGMGKLKWRMIECSVEHYPYPREICIEGILYYIATDRESRKDMIVCFNVKQETFSFIKNKVFRFPTTLINFKGKLGGICSSPRLFMDGRVQSFEFWVIDDTEEHTWSSHIHILPPMWKELVAETKVYIVGMVNGTSEVVFSPFLLSNPFYIFHLDMERNFIKRVEVQGLGPHKGQSIYTFLNHVENVNLIM